jgi:hypothetical protein
MRPVGTLGTDFTIRIVNPFFVRAADDPINHRYTLRIALLEKFEDLFVDRLVQTNVGCLRKPCAQLSGLLSEMTMPTTTFEANVLSGP